MHETDYRQCAAIVKDEVLEYEHGIVGSGRKEGKITGKDWFEKLRVQTIRKTVNIEMEITKILVKAYWKY